MITSRTEFNESWLTEMPEGLGRFDTFDQIEYNINDLKKNQLPIIKLTDNLNKVDLNQTAYYWYEKNNTILLGVELDKRPQGWTVRLTGKNPRFRGRPPYASDLYSAVLKDNQHYSIRLLSDTQLSDEGYAIWKRLFDQGHKISVYDRADPGKSFQTFASSDEFDQYFQYDNRDFTRYQYVLSETGAMLAETRSFFATRRYRELAGLSTED
jgi:hypothetical protein